MEFLVYKKERIKGKNNYDRKREREKEEKKEAKKRSNKR
jgi:hypothetical protein